MDKVTKNPGIPPSWRGSILSWVYVNTQRKEFALTLGTLKGPLLAGNIRH